MQHLTVGYNGRAVGEDNSSCDETPGNCGCVHAEANALLKLRAETCMLYTMYVTHSPCWHCAGLIINSQKIDRVYYHEEFRDSKGIARLKDAGIEVLRI
jgi:dCMP deaminase